jgi:hypothetical protein
LRDYLLLELDWSASDSAPRIASLSLCVIGEAPLSFRESVE